MNDPTNTSSSSNRAKQVPIDDALDSVRSGLSRADGERALAYEQLAVFRRAKSNLLTRHEKLLATKLGKDAPRVLALKGQREADLIQIRHLHVAHAVASTPLPQPSPVGFAVHGFIRDTNLVSVPQVMLALYDDTGKPRTDFKSAVSDHRGYFLMETERLQYATQPPAKEGETLTGPVTLEVRAFKDQRARVQIASAIFTAQAGMSHFAALITDDIGSSPNRPETGSKKPSAVPTDVRERLKDLTASIRTNPKSTTSGKSASEKFVRTASRTKPKHAVAPAKSKPKGATSRRRKKG